MRFLQLFAVGTAVFLFAGCTGYRLGPVNGQTAGAKSIQITPFANQTPEPRLGDAVTQALRERLQSDGTYRLATHGNGDIVVTGVITGYHREGLSFLPHDVLTVENFRVGATVHVTARERGAGRVLLDQVVNGYTLVSVGTDLADAQRQATPLLAEDLAGRIAGLLTESGW
jgi:hypothetical protein